MERDIWTSDDLGRDVAGRTRAEGCRYFLEKINACEHALPLEPLYKDLVCRGASEKCPVYREKSGSSYGPGDSRQRGKGRGRTQAFSPPFSVVTQSAGGDGHEL